jgi:hypothetical protein
MPAPLRNRAATLFISFSGDVQMPVNFHCPHCGTQTLVADQFIGHTGACASCGQPITVPGTPSAAVATAPVTSRTPMTLIIVVITGLMLLFCSGILVALLLPAINAAREAGRKTQCRSNLSQIGRALHNYTARFGCFPPAYVVDADGKPMHSWRVLILEELGRQDLYAQYDFDQPWDSPTNLALADKMPNVYQCPTDHGNSGEFTDFVAAVGPDRMFPGTDARKFSEVTDGLSNTIAVMEYSGSQINWLEPRDGPAANDPTAVQPPSSHHPGGAFVLLGDSSVQWLSASVNPQIVESLMTVDKGEPVSVP